MTNEQAKSELMQIYGMLSEEKKQALDMAIESLQAIPSADKWIPVSERLPDEGKEVLVQSPDGYLRVDWLLTEELWFWSDTEDETPIAWHELPSPYEPQESEDKE